MENQKIFIPCDDKCKMYDLILNSPYKAELRDKIEKMWVRFSPYCSDPHEAFLKGMRKDFEARLWELYLGNIFLEYDLNLQNAFSKKNNGAPDFKITLNGRTVWIEAVTCNQGDEKSYDRVPEAPRKVVGRMQDDRYILRYTSAISNKKSSMNHYVNKGIIKDEEIFIIALNAGNLPHADLESPLEIPKIIKAVLPIGDGYFRMSPETGEVIEEGYLYRSEINKTKKSENEETNTVPTNIFYQDDYQMASGILFSPISFTHLLSYDLSGNDLIFIHNPNAKNPLPKEILKFGKEYFIEKVEFDFKIKEYDHRNRKLNWNILEKR